MCSTDHRSTPEIPPSSPAAPSSPAVPGEPSQPPNVFDGAFLALLAERDEPDAAEEAEWAGPWRLERLREGGLGLFRLGESASRGGRPVAAFRQQSDALLTMAMIAARREPAYRLRPVSDGSGYELQSRAAWGEAVGWLDVFDEDLATGLSWADALMRSPEALAFVLEACGKVILERAGAILQERLGSAER